MSSFETNPKARAAVIDHFYEKHGPNAPLVMLEANTHITRHLVVNLDDLNAAAPELKRLMNQQELMWALHHAK